MKTDLDLPRDAHVRATGNRPPLRNYAAAALICALTTVVAAPLSDHFDRANIVMLFLLAVVAIAVALGRGPAVLAAFASVASFDFFFVPPRLSFDVNDMQYLLTFVVMLAVALIIGHLTAGVKRQADDALLREQRTAALYEMARELAGALQPGQVHAITGHFLRGTVYADVALLLAGSDGQLTRLGADNDGAMAVDTHFARAAYDNGMCADLDASIPVGYFPLRAPTRVRGVMAVAFPGDRMALLAEHRELLETVASLVAIAIERMHYVDVANGAQLQMVSERLRSSILAAVSHDLRTPLTALVGLADALAVGKPPLAVHQRESAEAIRDQAMRLAGLVGNLLDMARLHAGEVRLRKQWQPLAEVIGASLKLLERNLLYHAVSVDLAHDLPLLEFDAVLIERVFCNLLENAAKYSPAGAAIVISARVLDDLVEIAVCDKGGGIPAARTEDIFEMFVRGARESATPGVGLGLAICRAIVEAHGGSIAVHNRPGGACFAFTLPVGNPPSIEPEDAEAGNHG